MPHMVIQYTGHLEAQADMYALCGKISRTIIELKGEDGKQIFPTGGTRVLAYPAAHYAVADGQADYAFVYLNLRMGAGRSEAVKKRAGDALLGCAKQHFEPVFARRHLGLTLQIDESPGQVYDGKHGNLHPLFNK